MENGFIVYENGEKIPIDRFEKLYWEKNESARKLDLLRTNPEGYYQQYPDERPQIQQETQEEEFDPIEALKQTVVPSGVYEGWTIQQVFEVDQIAGNVLLQGLIDYRREQANKEFEAQEAEKAAENQRFKDAETETNNLSNELAQEIFGAKDYAALKPDQIKQIDAEVMRTIKWMTDNGKVFISPQEAYYLMDREKHLQSARAKGAREAVDSINKPSVPSIKVGGGVQAINVYEDMSDDELLAHVQAMPDATFQNFIKSASQSVKDRLGL